MINSKLTYLFAKRKKSDFLACTLRKARSQSIMAGTTQNDMLSSGISVVAFTSVYSEKDRTKKLMITDNYYDWDRKTIY